jgi:acyl carrier protein
VGLDIVELVLRTEDEFGITLTDAEAESAQTVGDLYQLILSKLDLTPSCLSSKAFYCTPQALVACLNVPRRSIRPSSELESLFPETTRKELWIQTARLIELEFPELRYPSRWRQRFWRVGIGASAIFILTCSMIVQYRFPGMISGITIWIPAFVLWIILSAVTHALFQRYASSLQTELPCQTAGDLSRLVLTSNYQHFSPTAAQNAAISKEFVWTKLVHIISDQLQIDPAEVVPSASFLHDLGAD